MTGGLFIALYDEDSLKLYLENGVYGFLMPPYISCEPTSRSRHYNILADYACSREGTNVFFFLKRKIVYAGTIYGNKNISSFYLNGETSPLGRKAHADLFWDESERYISTITPGVFKLKHDGNEKSQPFMFRFITNKNTGKYIISDDLYFELGKYPYPLPSNSMQGMGFCTLSPGEVTTLNALIAKSEKRIENKEYDKVNKSSTGTLFNDKWVSLDDKMINEAQLEFTILSSIAPFSDFLNDEYVLCRQVPISPFKPSQMDRADICLYSTTNPIKNGTIPNVIIELKKDTGNKAAYEQVERYLKWIKSITSEEEYSKVKAYIMAPTIKKIQASKVSHEYRDKISMYSINTKSFVSLKE